jgi:hypothetical protein
MMASKIPPPDAPAEALMQHSWEQITKTCPFDITHHAISIPCGLGESGRPIRLMLITNTGRNQRSTGSPMLSSATVIGNQLDRAVNTDAAAPGGFRANRSGPPAMCPVVRGQIGS